MIFYVDNKRIIKGNNIKKNKTILKINTKKEKHIAKSLFVSNKKTKDDFIKGLFIQIFMIINLKI
jgi:hypothetical protein